jgi:hypothetical protein
VTLRKDGEAFPFDVPSDDVIGACVYRRSFRDGTSNAHGHFNQESGYALGKGKRVVLIIEEGVEYPPTDLAADAGRISFKCRILEFCKGRAWRSGEQKARRKIQLRGSSGAGWMVSN